MPVVHKYQGLTIVFFTGFYLLTVVSYPNRDQVALGVLKKYIVRIFIEQDPREIIEELEKMFAKYIEPVSNSL